MANADTPKPDPAMLRDPRMAWTFIFGGFALLFFDCTLIVIGNPGQRGFVYFIFFMAVVMFVTSGNLKASDAVSLIKSITGKG
jgi:hypothetical protein